MNTAPDIAPNAAPNAARGTLEKRMDIGSPGRSVRVRLLLIVLAPPILLLPLVIVLLWTWGERYYDAVLRYKISSDLGAAHAYFERVVGQVGDGVEALAASAGMARGLESPESLPALLLQARDAHRLDFLILLAMDGSLRSSATASDPNARWLDQPMPESAQRGFPASGLGLLSEQQLAALAPALAHQARITLVPTPQAGPADRPVETRGLLIRPAEV